MHKNNFFDFFMFWKKPYHPSKFLLIFTLFSYLMMLGVSIVTPDTSLDGNMYHIPPLAMWNDTGYISWIDTVYLEPIINGYPKGSELISFILVKSLNNSVINSVTLLFLPVGVLGIAHIAQVLTRKRLLSLSIGSIFILIPIIMRQSITTYVDASYAATAIGAISMFVNLIDNTSYKKVDVFITGLSLGLAISIKSTGLILSVFSIFLYLTIVLLRNNRSTIRDLIKSYSKWLPNIFIHCTMLLLGAITVGGFWYIRNYLQTGSPIYPAGLQFFDFTIFPGKTLEEIVKISVMTPDILLGKSMLFKLLYTWSQGFFINWPGSISTYDSRIGGLGFIWLFGCLPSILITIYWCIKKKTEKIYVFSFLFFSVCMTFLFTPMNWWSRFVVWIYALGLPLLAYVINQYHHLMMNYPKLKKNIILLWLASCFTLCIIESSYSLIHIFGQASPISLRENISYVIKKETWEWPTSYLFPELQDTIVEDILSQNLNVAISPHWKMNDWYYYGLVGQLSQPIDKRNLVFLDIKENIEYQLTQKDINYIIWDKTISIPNTITTEAITYEEFDSFVIFKLP
jgi:hypothetical protein